jgi:hypothetical protein
MAARYAGLDDATARNVAWGAEPMPVTSDEQCTITPPRPTIGPR